MGGEELKTFALALLFLAAGLFIHTSIISAQEAGEELPAAAEPWMLPWDYTGVPDGALGGNTVWPIVRMLLTLSLAAAAVYGVVFFIKKAGKKSEAKDPFLKILATAPLGLNRYAHVVSVGSKAWLLGSSDGGVNLIGEINDKDILNAMLLEESQKAADIPSGKLPDFLSMLRRLGLPVEKNTGGANEIKKHRERLKGL